MRPRNLRIYTVDGVERLGLLVEKSGKYRTMFNVLNGKLENISRSRYRASRPLIFPAFYDTVNEAEGYAAAWEKTAGEGFTATTFKVGLKRGGYGVLAFEKGGAK